MTSKNRNHEFKVLQKDQRAFLLKPLFNGVLFLIYYFEKHFKPCFFSTLNSWIGEFVVSLFLCHEQVICEFSTVWADWVVFDCTENFCDFAKVSYFWGCFFLSRFGWQNKYKSSVSALKKLINIKVGKRTILALKCTFLGQNRLLNIKNQF